MDPTNFPMSNAGGKYGEALHTNLIKLKKSTHSAGWVLFWYTAKMKKDRSELHGAYVWVVSALALMTYGILGYLEMKIPGVEDLVAFLEGVEGWYVYLAAFLSIFIEGLYFIGSIFPGSTLIVLLAILSQVSGFAHFAMVILMIFIGWCFAGVANIYIARAYRSTILKNLEKKEQKVEDNILMTWFPAFRANYEVAQITEGASPWKVFLSSVRVKFFVSLAGAVYTLLLPFFLDISELSNKEGFATLAVVALITLSVGVLKILQFHGKIDFDF